MYYRLSITTADNTGAPVGSRNYYQTGLSWTKAIGGGVIVPVNLGPNLVGTENYLYQIPYDAPDNNWESDQYHAHLDTTDSTWSDPLVRHLVTIEIFDSAGKRLRPNGTPATGQGGSEGTAPFTYRRKTAATGPTTDVPFGALTHMFWWDNRPVHVEIVELVQDGVASTAECQFLVGTPARSSASTTARTTSRCSSTAITRSGGSAGSPAPLATSSIPGSATSASRARPAPVPA